MGRANRKPHTITAAAAAKGHFFLQAMNIITKAIPQMMIPELKLLIVTKRARGRINAAIISHDRSSLISFPSFVMTTASTRITVTLTSSVGWNRTALVPSHRFLPFTSMPRLVKSTRIIQT